MKLEATEKQKGNVKKIRKQQERSTEKIIISFKNRSQEKNSLSASKITKKKKKKSKAALEEVIQRGNTKEKAT